MKKSQSIVLTEIMDITGIHCPETEKVALVKPGTGFIWSSSAQVMMLAPGYLIPSNMFAVVALGYLEEMEREIFHNEELAEKAKSLKEEVAKKPLRPWKNFHRRVWNGVCI